MFSSLLLKNNFLLLFYGPFVRRELLSQQNLEKSAHFKVYIDFSHLHIQFRHTASWIQDVSHRMHLAQFIFRAEKQLKLLPNISLSLQGFFCCSSATC